MSDSLMRRADARSAADRWRFPAALLWALVAMYAAHALDFPGSLVDFTRASGGGTLLDLEPAFSEAELYRRLDAYGETGRANYAFRNLSVDLLLPLSLLPFLYLLMRLALRGFSPGRAVRGALLALPFVYVAFDMAENASVLLLLSSYPDRVSWIAALLPYLTVVKRSAVLLAASVPLLLLAGLQIRAEFAKE